MRYLVLQEVYCVPFTLCFNFIIIHFVANHLSEAMVSFSFYPVFDICASSPLKLHVGHKKQQQQNGYSTWDPRKAKNGEVPQYDEIPYGDVGPVGPSGKGQLPEVPAEYSQVPQIPQRQGIIVQKLTETNSIIPHGIWNGVSHCSPKGCETCAKNCSAKQSFLLKNKSFDLE